MRDRVGGSRNEWREGRKDTYHITTPTSSPTSSKVWQTSSKRRNRFRGINTSTLDQTILLNSSKGEIVGERMS